jgi:hypothetical protein
MLNQTILYELFGAAKYFLFSKIITGEEEARKSKQARRKLCNEIYIN